MDSSDWASIALFKIERVWAAKTVDRYRKKLQLNYLFAFHFHFVLSKCISLTPVPIANILQLVHLIISDLRLNNFKVFQCSMSEQQTFFFN